MYQFSDGDFSPEKIAESGQCFRMTRCGEQVWQLIAAGKVLFIRAEETADSVHGAVTEAAMDAAAGSGRQAETAGRAADEGKKRQAAALELPQAFCLSADEEEFHAVWEPYFDLQTDYEVYRSTALSDDYFLKKAIRYGSGIRVLRQDPWEMLISFIISQRRSVPAIRTAVRKLSERFGREIHVGKTVRRQFGIEENQRFFAFPAPKALAKAPSEELAACGLGYRTDYVKAAARAVQSCEMDLSAFSELSDEELLSELMRLPGVGIKVASCTALFGYHRLRVAPVDVWMQRILDADYAQFGGKFPQEYTACAGVLQQYLFHYARRTKSVEAV